MTICWCGAPASGLHAYFCPARRNEPDLEYATKGTTARLVEAEAAIQRVRELCSDDLRTGWFELREDILRALDGDA